MSREGVSDSRPSKRNLSFGGRTFSFREIEMIIDFHHHYTPPELMRTSQDGSTVLLDENGESQLSLQ
jgi:hypothetical protein